MEEALQGIEVKFFQYIEDVNFAMIQKNNIMFIYFLCSAEILDSAGYSTSPDYNGHKPIISSPNFLDNFRAHLL